jgi:flagellar basal body L-ring protein FlgH
MTRLSQYGSGSVSMTDWDGNTEHVYDDDYKNPARKTGYYVWVGSSKYWFRTKKAANRFYMTRLSQYGSGSVSMTDWDGNTEHVYDDDYKNPARKVKGKSTTLKNMASVTVTKLPNGVVKITGRKMAGKRVNRARKARKR